MPFLEDVQCNVPNDYDGGKSDDDDEDYHDGISKVKLTDKTDRRKTIVAPSYIIEEDWLPPIHKKRKEEEEDILRSIKCNFLFSSLDEKDLNIIVQAMERFNAIPNEKIIIQHSEGDLFYIIQDGICDIYVNDELISKVEGGTKNNFFGELALLYDSPRAATIIATTFVSGWTLDRMTLKKIIMDTTIRRRNLYSTFLNEVSILSTLTKRERMILADALTPLEFHKNEIIITENTLGDEFFIIEYGEVKCTKWYSQDIDNNNDKHKNNLNHLNMIEKEVSRRLTTGDYFGEMALLTDERRRATVTATKETKLLKIDRHTFKRIFGPLETILKKNSELYDKYLE